MRRRKGPPERGRCAGGGECTTFSFWIVNCVKLRFSLCSAQRVTVQRVTTPVQWKRRLCLFRCQGKYAHGDMALKQLEGIPFQAEFYRF